MKKILSFVLALLMVVSCASLVFADEEAAIADETLIAPAAAASPYADAIKLLNEEGILQGRDNYDLATEEPVKRYEMAIFVARLATGWIDNSVWKEANPNASKFDDLEGSGAINYLGALSYAEQNGIIEGRGNNKFDPETGVTYQEALTMVVRTLGYKGLAYPWGYIEKAVQLGLTKGIEGISYTTQLNRGEVAQIIYNVQPLLLAILSPSESGTLTSLGRRLLSPPLRTLPLILQLTLLRKALLNSLFLTPLPVNLLALLTPFPSAKSRSALNPTRLLQRQSAFRSVHSSPLTLASSFS